MMSSKIQCFLSLFVIKNGRFWVILWSPDGPRWTQDGLRRCQDGSRCRQDGPRWPQDGPRVGGRSRARAIFFGWNATYTLAQRSLQYKRKLPEACAALQEPLCIRRRYAHSSVQEDQGKQCNFAVPGARSACQGSRSRSGSGSRSSSSSNSGNSTNNNY